MAKFESFDSRQSVDLKWKLRKTLEKYITVFDGDLNIGDSDDSDGALYVNIPVHLRGDDSLDVSVLYAGNRVSAGEITARERLKISNYYFAEASGSNIYVGNKQSTMRFLSDKKSTAVGRLYVEAADGEVGVIIDSLKTKPSIVEGSIKSGTQQWFSSETNIAPLLSFYEFYVLVKDGSSSWGAFFAIYGTGNEVAFPIPTSTTEVVYGRAKVINDSSEGSVGALKIDLDSMSLGSGYTVTVSVRNMGKF